MLQHDHILISTLLVVFDLIGTFVFALSGAAAGIKHRLDLFGVLVLSFAAANGGGIARDLMIGAIPPVGVSDWRYIIVDTAAGLLAFALARATHTSPDNQRWAWFNERLTRTVGVLDASGLGLFA
ncbi:MAG TPA: TRIC cation channel family protein, partial [Gemmatimonadaceae bacterium]|nr:TRIC cation channel family protein [Gemmatimonadaceae bacterium]